MTLSAPTNDQHHDDLPSPSSDSPGLRRIHSEITYSQIADVGLHMSSKSSKPVDGSATRVISFGPFSLLPDQRQLLEVDKLLNIGSRAFDILLALVESPRQLISKEELMARGWADLLRRACQSHSSCCCPATGFGRWTRRTSVLGQYPGARLSIRRPGVS